MMQIPFVRFMAGGLVITAALLSGDVEAQPVGNPLIFDMWVSSAGGGPAPPVSSVFTTPNDEAIVLDPSGDILVTDAVGGGTSTISPPGGANPVDLTLGDDSGTVFVLDTNANQVIEIDLSSGLAINNILPKVGGNPLAIGADDRFTISGGNMAITDVSNNSVRQFDLATVQPGGSVEQQIEYDVTPLGNLTGDDKIFYIKGNLWVHTAGPDRFLFPSGEGTQISLVAEGNIFISDNFTYEDLEKDAIAFIALKSPTDFPDVLPPEGSGDVRFEDPAFGTTFRFAGYMFAENDFYADNVSNDLFVYGNMTAGNIVNLSWC